MRYTFSALPGAERSNAMLRALRKPIRTVLAWQLAATIVMSLAAAVAADLESARSAAAGGGVSMIAGLASALVASVSNAKSAGGILAGALRAEAVKLGVALLLLWLVLANYTETGVAVVFRALVLAVLVFFLAFFFRG